MSFINIENSKGFNFKPWGTPEIRKHSEIVYVYVHFKRAHFVDFTTYPKIMYAIFWAEMLCWLHIDSLHRQSGPFWNGRTHITVGKSEVRKHMSSVLLTSLSWAVSILFFRSKNPKQNSHDAEKHTSLTWGSHLCWGRKNNFRECCRWGNLFSEKCIIFAQSSIFVSFFSSSVPSLSFQIF